MADLAIEQRADCAQSVGRRRGMNVSCHGCGRLHYRKASQLAKSGADAKLFCSRACLFAESAKRSLTCDTCGREYVRFRSQGKRGRRTFCSRKCHALHGLIYRSCCWPGCTETFPCRVTRGTARDGADEYKTNLVKKGRYTKYAFCAAHALTVRSYLGEGVRFSRGRGRIFSNPDHEYGVRALSSKFTRMFIFERAGRKCQSCGDSLDWDAPPKTWEVDHIIPVFKGGRTTLRNLQVLCRHCHDEKSATEKSEATRERHALTKLNRWMTHHEKDLLIARLRARLEALGAPTD
jgi:hypothetical protein